MIDTKSVLVVFGLMLTSTAQAMPTNIKTDVYLTSYFCGEDSCYIDFELADVTGVNITAWCGDNNYCDKLYKMASTKYNNELDLQSKPARITMTLEENPYSGTSTYSVDSIDFL